MKITYITLIILLLPKFILSMPFHQMHNKNELWAEMQDKYIQLNHSLSIQNLIVLEKIYCNTWWMTLKQQFRLILLNKLPPNSNFLSQNAVSAMMRLGMNREQQYEICFLESCLNKNHLNLIKSYQDTNFNSIPFECREFNCSANTLGHLYYVAKVLEKESSKNTKINKIIEFGGGYGNLARIFKSIKPSSTILIIDLSEFIALQYLFLKTTLPDTKIIIHTQPTSHYEDGAIHLVSVHFLESINFDPDLFISTFGLTEVPHTVQSIIAKKSFFNASMTYLVGQLNGWKPTANFEHHQFLHKSIRNMYKDIQCYPFHIYETKPNSYEIIGSSI